MFKLSRYALGLIVLAATLVVVKPAPVQALYDGSPGTITSSPYAGKSYGWRPATYWIGDSVSYEAVDTLRIRGFTGEVDARPGREVNTLPMHLADRLSNKSKLNRVVIALGTNSSPDWTYTDLRNQVLLLKRHGVKKIVLVTPYRDGRYKIYNTPSDFRRNYKNSATYANWMRIIARNNKGVCLADWAKVVSRKPTKLLRDGVHTKFAGEKARNKLVLKQLQGKCR